MFTVQQSGGEMKDKAKTIPQWFNERILAVPIRVKVVGIGLLPILILGFTLSYWITSGLSDWLSYLLSDVRVQAAMQAGQRSVNLVTFIAAVASIFFSLVLSYILSRPILALMEMAQQVAGGNLDARAKVWAKDEIGELAISINTMTDNLVKAQEDLARKNRNLDAINQVALAGNRQEEIHDVLYEILNNILKITHLRTGWIYLRDPEKNSFHLASWSGVAEHEIPFYLNILGSSPCTCQQIYTGTVLNLNARMYKCERLKRSSLLDTEKAHITIPLYAREQYLGVINLLCSENTHIAEEDMELLSSIGSQIAEIVANAWLHLKLVEKEAARQMLLRSLVEAQEEERRRLARELHDGAGQTLTSLLVRLKTLEKKAALPHLEKDLQVMQNLVSDTIEQIRSLAHQLRPAALEELGLSLALETMVKEMSEHEGLEGTYHCSPGIEGIPDEIGTVIYRIAQEGLTNVLRHSQASRFSLNIERDPSGIFMLIEDNGAGFDPAALGNEEGKRHLGLMSMRERAEVLGGALDVYTALGKGTTIQVYVPYREHQDAS